MEIIPVIISGSFCLAPRWKNDWPQWIFFFSPLKFLNLVLIPDAKSYGRLGTWAGCSETFLHLIFISSNYFAWSS